MNRLLLCGLFSIILASTIYGQSPIEVTTRDGRTIILKPDGTWEFKKVAAEPSATRVEAPVKSNVPVDSLPSNFQGHDTKNLYTQLLDLKQRLVKSEFETTAQYERRVAEEVKKAIIADLTITDTFSIVVPGIRSEYDADSQKMKFFLPVEKNLMAELQRRTVSARDRKTARDLSYVALYNIQLLGERGYEKDLIFFDGTNDLMLTERSSLNADFVAEVRVGVEEARRLKGMIKAALLVRFEEPYIAGYGRFDRQFQVQLIDVLFFDPQTGKILAKMSQARK